MNGIPYEVLYFLGVIWFVAVFKNIIFYIYLWQLKAYHIGRFLDHFNTAKGKSLILNELNYFKLFLLVVYLPAPLLVFFGAVVLYLFGFAKAIFDFIFLRFRRPVFTKKVLFLIVLSLLSEGIFLFFAIIKSGGLVYLFSLWLLLFDFFTPVIVSFIVLIFQPLTVYGRNKIIKSARQKRESFKDLLVIGVTGSYGKTSSKEFLAAILAEKFIVLKTSEHQNSEVGISRCIINDLRPEHQVFVVEMGAYNRGGIRLLCSIAKPKIGVLAGINEQHMATFGSQENIIKGKYELIEGLPKDGMAFFNGKNKYCVQLFEKTQGIKKFLYGQEAEFFGEENILGAMKVAKELGMTDEEIERGVSKIKDKMPGVKVKKGINGLNVIDATYSANPTGVMANLEYLKNFPGKKIVIMPCLIELGRSSKEVHRRIGQKIAEVCDLAIITTLDRFKEIKKTAGNKAIFVESPNDIFEKIMSVAKDGDVILLESRVANSFALTNKLFCLLGALI